MNKRRHIVQMEDFQKMLLGLKDLLESNLDFYGGNQVGSFYKTFILFQRMLTENIGRPSISLNNDERRLFQRIQDLKPAKQALTPKRALREIRLLREEIAALKKRPAPH